MDDDGFVPLSFIVTFKRIQNLDSSIPAIVQAMANSSVVEIKGDKIREKENWAQYVFPPKDRQAPGTDDKPVKVNGIPRKNSTHGDATESEETVLPGSPSQRGNDTPSSPRHRTDSSPVQLQVSSPGRPGENYSLQGGSHWKVWIFGHLPITIAFHTHTWNVSWTACFRGVLPWLQRTAVKPAHFACTGTISGVIVKVTSSSDLEKTCVHSKSTRRQAGRFQRRGLLRTLNKQFYAC